MRHLSYLIALLSFCALPSTITAQTQADFSDDIIATYTDMIAAKPQSADLYVSRATEYISRGLLMPAAEDLRTALTLCNKSDKPLRFEILVRLADIEERRFDYASALSRLNEAVELYPEVPSVINSRAKLETTMGNYDAARADYMRLRKINPRNITPFFGLAKIAALQNDSETAHSYINQAYGLLPNASSTYIGHGEVLEILGRKNEAIAQYINALATGDAESGNALHKLESLSQENFPEVKEAFDKAIQKAPTAGMLYYFRGALSQAHNRHSEAIRDFDHINNSGPFAGGALNETIAESLIALNRPAEAKELLGTTSPRFRDAVWHNTMSQAMLDLNMADSAMVEADKALRLSPDMADAMISRSRALISLGDKPGALAAISEAILTNPNIPEAYFIKASLMANPESTLRELLELDCSPTDPSSLRGFALLALKQEDQADGWIGGITLHGNDSDGSASYIAACYYAQRGDKDKSSKYLERAKAAGYDNPRSITTDTTPYISLNNLPD